MQVATMERETDMVVKRLSVPMGLEELMESLTKEVLRRKPADIYAFASQHFAQLLEIRDQGNARGSLRRLRKSSSQISKTSEDTRDNTKNPVKVKSATFGTMTKMPRSKSPAPKSFLTRKNVQAKVDSNISPRTLHNNNKNSKQEKTKMLMDKRRAVKKKAVDEKKQIESNKQPLELESKKIVQIHRKSDNTKLVVDQRRRSVTQTANEEKRVKDNLRSRSINTNKEGEASKNIVDKSKRKTDQTRKIEEGRRRKSSSKSEDKLEKINIDGKSLSKEIALPGENMQDVNVPSSNMSDISDSVVTQMEKQNLTRDEKSVLDGDTSQKTELYPTTFKDMKQEMSGFNTGDREESEASIITEKQKKSSMDEVSVTDDNKELEEYQSENSDVTTEETDKISDAKIDLIISNITGSSDVISDKSEEKIYLDVDPMKAKEADIVPRKKQDSIENADANEEFLKIAKVVTEEQQFQEDTLLRKSSQNDIKNDNGSEKFKNILEGNEQIAILDDDVYKDSQGTTKDSVEQTTQDSLIHEGYETNLKSDSDAAKNQGVLATNKTDSDLNDGASNDAPEATENDIEKEQSSIVNKINAKNDSDIASLQLAEDNDTTIESLEVDNCDQNRKGNILDITRAVIKIQSLVRGYLTRKAINENRLKPTEYFDSIGTKVITDTPIEIEDPQPTIIDQIKAATKIQSMMRGYLARKFLKKNQLEFSKDNAKVADDIAIKSKDQIIVVENNKLNVVEVELLQGESERSNDDPLLVDRERYTKEEIAAAAKIQALTRGYLTRKLMNKKRPFLENVEETNEVEILDVDKSDSLNDERNNDAKVTQNIEELEIVDKKIIPGVSSAAREDHEPVKNLMDRSVAAGKIQALTRGYLTRKAINRNKNNNRVSEEMIKVNLDIADQTSKKNDFSPVESNIKSTIDLTRAAVIIQALFKGYLVRKKNKEPTELLMKTADNEHIIPENEKKIEKSQIDIHEDIDYKNITSSFLGLEHVHYESNRYDDAVVKLREDATESIAETISEQEKPISTEDYEPESQDNARIHKDSESTGFNAKEPFGDDVGPKPSKIEKIADVSNYMKSETIMKPMEISDLQKPPECDEMPHQRGHRIAEDAMKAATVIQALFRGYMIRKGRDNTESRLARKKTFEDKLPTVLEVEDEENRDSETLVDVVAEKLPPDAIEKIEVQISSEEPYLHSEKSNSTNLEKNKTLSDDEVFAILKQLDDTPVPKEEPRRKSKSYTRSFTIDEPSIQQTIPLSKSMTFVIGDEFQSFDTVDSVDQSLKTTETDGGSTSIDSTDSHIAEMTTAIKEDVQKLKRTLENGLEMEKIVNVEGIEGDGNITEITKGISDDVKQLEKTLSQDFVVEKANLNITSDNLDRSVQGSEVIEESEEFSMRPLSKDSVTSTDSVDTVIFNDKLKTELVGEEDITSNAERNVDNDIESKQYAADVVGLNMIDLNGANIENTSEELEQMNVAKEQSDILVNDILDTAATKIQKFFRDLRNKSGSDGRDKETETLEQTSPDLVQQELTARKRQSTTSDELRQLWQDEAATTIQKNYKGYRVRRNLDNKKQGTFDDKKYKEELVDKEITRYLGQITEPVRRAFSADKHQHEHEPHDDQTRVLSVNVSKPDTVYIPLRDYSDENQDENGGSSNSHSELAPTLSLQDNEINQANTEIELKSDISEVVEEELFVKQNVKDLSTLSEDSKPDNRIDKEITQVDPNSENIADEDKPNKEAEEKMSSYITAMVEPIKSTFRLRESIDEETIVEEPEPVYQYIPLKSYSEDEKVGTVTVIDDNVVTSMSTLKEDIDNNGIDVKIDDEEIISRKFDEIASEVLNDEESISEKFEAIASKALDKTEESEEVKRDVIKTDKDHALDSVPPTESIVINSEEGQIVGKNLNTEEAEKVVVKSDSLQLNTPAVERYASKEIDQYISSIIEPVKQKFSPYKEKAVSTKQDDVIPKVEEPVYKYIPLRDYSVEGSEELKKEESGSIDDEGKILGVEKLSTGDSVHFLGVTNLTDNKLETHAAMENKPEAHQQLDRLEEDIKSTNVLRNVSQTSYELVANGSKEKLNEVGSNIGILEAKKEVIDISNQVQEVKKDFEKPMEVTTFNKGNLNMEILKSLDSDIVDESEKELKQTLNQMDNNKIVNHLQKSEQVNELKEALSDISTTGKLLDENKQVYSLDVNNTSKTVGEKKSRDLEDNKNENLNSDVVLSDHALKSLSSQNSNDADQNTSIGDDTSMSADSSASSMENIIKIEIKDKLLDENTPKSRTTEEEDEVDDVDNSTLNLTNIEDDYDESAIDEEGKISRKESAVKNGDVTEVRGEEIEANVNSEVPKTDFESKIPVQKAVANVNSEISKTDIESKTPVEKAVENDKLTSKNEEKISTTQEEHNKVKGDLVIAETKNKNKSLGIELGKETDLGSPEAVVTATNSKNDNNKKISEDIETTNDKRNTDIEKVSEIVLPLNERENKSLHNAATKAEKIHAEMDKINGETKAENVSVSTNNELEIDHNFSEERVLQDNVISHPISSFDEVQEIKTQDDEDNTKSNLPESDILTIKEDNEQILKDELTNKDTSTGLEISDEEMQARIEHIEFQIEDVLGKINNTAASATDNSEKCLNESDLLAENLKEENDNKLAQQTNNKESIDIHMGKADVDAGNKKTENDEQPADDASIKELQKEDKHEMPENDNKVTTSDFELSNKHDFRNEDKNASENIDIRDVPNNLEKDVPEANNAIAESTDVSNKQSQDLDHSKNDETQMKDITKTQDNLEKYDISTEHISNNLANKEHTSSDTISNANINETMDATKVENVSHADIVKNINVSQPALENVDADKDNILPSTGNKSHLDKVAGDKGTNKCDLPSVSSDIKNMKVERTDTDNKIIADSNSGNAADLHSNLKESDKVNDTKSNGEAILSGDDVTKQPIPKEVNTNMKSYDNDTESKTGIKTSIGDGKIAEGETLEAKSSSDVTASEAMLEDMETNKGVISTVDKESNVNELESQKDNKEVDFKEITVDDVPNEVKVTDGSNAQNVTDIGPNNTETETISNKDADPSDKDKKSTYEDIEHKYDNKAPDDNNLQSAIVLQPNAQESNVVDLEDKIQNLNTDGVSNIEQSDFTKNLTIEPKEPQTPFDVLQKEQSLEDKHMNNKTPINSASTLDSPHIESQDARSDDYNIESINITPVREEQIKNETEDNALHKASKLHNLISTGLDANRSDADDPKNKIEEIKKDDLTKAPSTKKILQGDKSMGDQTIVSTAHDDQPSEEHKDNKNALVLDEKAPSIVDVDQIPVGEAKADAVAKETEPANLDLTNSEKAKTDDGGDNNSQIVAKNVEEQLKPQINNVQQHEESDEPKNLQLVNGSSDSQTNDVLEIENLGQATAEKIIPDTHLQHEGNVNEKNGKNQVEGVSNAKTELVSNEIPEYVDKTSPFYLHQDIFFQNTPSMAQERKFSEALRLSTDSDKQVDNTETSEQLLHSSEYHDSIPVNVTTEASEKPLNTQTNGVQCNIGRERTMPTSTVLVHSGELHDNILPLTLQMNQDPGQVFVIIVSGIH